MGKRQHRQGQPETALTAPSMRVTEVYQDILLTELLFTMHTIFEDCLICLETIYTTLQGHGAPADSVDAVMMTILCSGEEEDAESLPEQQAQAARLQTYGSVLNAIEVWITCIKINDPRVIELCLAVLCSQSLEPSRRKYTLRQHLLDAFQAYQRRLEINPWAEIALGPPPTPPEFVPTLMSRDTYLVQFQEKLAAYTKKVMQVYEEHGYIAPPDRPEQQKHIRLLAEYILSGEGVNQLARRLSTDGLQELDGTVRRKGFSAANISTVLRQTCAALGVQFEDIDLTER